MVREAKHAPTGSITASAGSDGQAGAVRRRSPPDAARRFFCDFRTAARRFTIDL